MYVDALYDRSKECVMVMERRDGQRNFINYPAKHVFYYADPDGRYKSIYGTPVSRFETQSSSAFRKETLLYPRDQTFEADIDTVFRCLADNYLKAEAPKLNVAFFDIETDFEKPKNGKAGRGFAPTNDPFNKITAITVYLAWLDQLITMALPPDTLTFEQATEVGNEFENTIIFRTEAEMLDVFLGIIEDADVLSGWNSEGYDIPYTVNRIVKVMSKDETRRMCLWGKYPKKRIFERYGAEHETYDLHGRVHMDYMQLYRKYTYEERHSYALDAIGEYELNERKVPYEGSLDQLYNNEFKKFLEYNRQDVALLAKLDKKLKFMDLANQLAHENTVLLPTTMGAVAVTEQAIINEAHERGLIVPNRKMDQDPVQAAGGFVAFPKKGLHDWIGSIDINSLYPSVIRALNMAPETIVGQITPTFTDEYIAGKVADVPMASGRTRKGCTFSEAWEGMFGSIEYELVMDKDRETIMEVAWEDGDLVEMTGAQIYDLVFAADSNVVLSANGTIFAVDRPGIVPGLLERWYAERKVLQKELKKWDELAGGIDLPERLK